MSAFEEFLISQGFQKMKWTEKGLIPARPTDRLSSMDNLDFRYVKDDLVIVYGLNENHLPPTLIHPRPNMIKEGNIYRSYRDYDAQRWLADTPFDEILKEIKIIHDNAKKAGKK